MKRFALVCLLSLPLVGLSHQEAKAWCKFCVGGSFNLSFQSGGKQFCWTSDSMPYDCGAPACPGYGYAYGYAAPAPAAAPAPVVPAAWYPDYYGSAYNYGYGYGYGYYPAYWYGR
jgi:hypothetical protein